MSDQIMSVDDVADYLKMKPITIRRQAERGNLPAFKIGNRWKFRFSDLKKFIDDQIHQQTFAKKVDNLWKEIRSELDSSEISAEDVPEIIKQVREDRLRHESVNSD